MTWSKKLGQPLLLASFFAFSIPSHLALANVFPPAASESRSFVDSAIPAEAAAQTEPVVDEASAPPPVRTWGSVRTRYSHLSGQFRNGLDEADQALQLRTLLNLRLDLGTFAAHIEVQDSRAYLTDENSAVSTIVVNALEPLQLYVELSFEHAPGSDNALTIRVGRQTMDLGSRRHIARNRYRNTIQSYTGLTFDWQAENEARIYAFAVLPTRVQPENSDQDALLQNEVALDRESFDLQFYGVFASLPVGTSSSLETYFYTLQEATGRGRRLYTPGARFIRAPSADSWDADVELTLQGGRRQATSPDGTLQRRGVLSGFAHASAGYTFTLPLELRLSAELDYATGDHPSANRYERFDTLFGPRRTEFGPTGIYGPLGRENLVSAGTRVASTSARGLSTFVSWRVNWLDSRSDVFARTGRIDPTGTSGSFAGHQIEFRARYWLAAGVLRGELGGAAFLPGRFLRETSEDLSARPTLFGYADLELFLD